MNSLKSFLETFLKIILPKNYDDTTHEQEVESRITEIMSKLPIDNTVTKDDFIRLIIRIYWKDKKYKPYVSKTVLILKYLIYILIIILIIMWIYANIVEFNTRDIEIRKKIYTLWKIFANLTYFFLMIYLLFNIYEQIRKIYRHEIKKKRLIKNILKPFLLIILIPFTWFIGSALWSISNYIQASIIELMK